MRRLVATVAVSVVVLGTTSAGAKQPLLLAMVWKDSVVSLTRVDTMSLQPVRGPSLPIGGGAYLVARSPRGVTLAFNTPRGAVLTFVDVRTLKQRGLINLGEGGVGAAAWPTARRLVAVVNGDGHCRVVTVDPATRKKLTDRALPLRAQLLDSEATANRVVFLLGDTQSIGPVQLGVAGIDGAVRMVTLDQVKGGTLPPEDYSTGVLKIARPAVVVGPAGTRAVVVGAGGVVAAVDLGTLAVSYHSRASRVPARVGKAVNGWQRSALWLASGRIAVTGIDYQGSVSGGQEEMSGTGAGLTLIDTRDWSSSKVDDGASFAARAGGVLVAFGGAYVNGSASRQPGIGLRGYGADGTLRFQLFGTEQIGDVQAAHGLVYVSGCDLRSFRIVDPVSGKMVGTAKTSMTTMLVGL
jgi:hypothetical protein